MNTHAFGAGDPNDPATRNRKEKQAEARAAKDKQQAKDSKTK
jgi:hypothetical protein